ncbi:MAG: YCF48-related protein [Ignavibacteria bacterium]
MKTKITNSNCKKFLHTGFITAGMVLVLFFTSIQTNSQWVPQNSGTNVFLNSIYFKSYNTGYACGFGGLTLRTTNSGANWTPMQTIAVTYLYSVHFLTEQVGFVCGTNGKICRTTDGSSWVTQTTPTTQTLRSITFSGSNAGFAVGDNGMILKTTDGGANWMLPNLDQSGSDNYFSVSFTSSTTGWVCGYNTNAVIRKTTDGGLMWNSQPAGPGNYTLRDIKFLNSTTGIAVGDGGYIIRTTNGGTNWVQSASGITTDLMSIDIGSIGLSNIIWYTAGFGGKILKSTNDGLTWGQLTSGTTNNLFEIDVCTNSRDSVFTCGGQGIIIKTLNGGGSFVGIQQNSNSIPSEFSLEQNYPNPFNPSTNISFSIPAGSYVSLDVFDMTGRIATTLISENMTAGNYNVEFNAAGFSSGVYFYRLNATSNNGTFTKTLKLILVK